MPTTADPHGRTLVGERRWLATSAIAAPIACGCCLVAGAAYVAAVNPSERGGFLPCPFRSITGWWCPGCGLTRATHHLLRGDVVQALRFNVFVVVVIAAVAVGWFGWLRRSVSGAQRRSRRIPTWAVGAAITLVVAFAVVRNLPGIDGLRG